MPMRLSIVFLSFVVLLPGRMCGAAEEKAPTVRPVVAAHAHNDYEHKRPLHDALGQGFCSVEADIFLVAGKLLVAHNLIDVRPSRTLEALYLDPLARRVKKNGGRVYRGGPEFTLLVDIKSDGATTYKALAKVLARYGHMLTTSRGGKLEKKAVTVVISGNRHVASIKADRIRYAGIDGRLGDLNSDAPAGLMPLISDRWTSHFRWRGEGAISKAEREKLEKIVAKAHAGGRRIRFWATPEKTSVWKELHRAGVDHINTDDLAGLAKFLRAVKKGK